MGKCFHLCCCCTDDGLWGSQSLLPPLLPLPLWFLRAARTNMLNFILKLSVARLHFRIADSHRADVTLCVQNPASARCLHPVDLSREQERLAASDNKAVPSSARDWLNWICNLCAATSSSSAWLAVTVTRGLFICAVVRFFSSLHTFFFSNLFLAKGLQDSSLLYPLCRQSGYLRLVGAGESAKAWSWRRAAGVKGVHLLE